MSDQGAVTHELLKETREDVRRIREIMEGP